MTSRLSFRQLLGLLLAWALLPLPFSGIVMLPFLVVPAVVAATLLLRRGALSLSNTKLNLLGLVILVVVVAAGGLRFGPLRPLGHLLLLLSAVRAVMVVDRATFMRALPGTGLVWVISVASSTHISLALYLLASAVLAWWAGMVLLLDGLPRPAGTPAAAGLPAPRMRHAVVAGVMSLLLAVPVFFGMPRLPRPWLALGGGIRAVSGFTTAVELARVGEIKESREAALTMRTANAGEIRPQWTRLRATAYDLIRTGVWTPRRNPLVRPTERAGLIWLDPDRENLDGTAELEIELVHGQRYLFLPAGTVAVRSEVPLAVDPVGGLMVAVRRPPPCTYRVWVESPPRPRTQLPGTRDTFLAHSNPEVHRYALDLARGQEDPEALANMVSRHLADSFEYSLIGPERFENDPVAWFLLRGRHGHCEFFAGSMVILLRHLGVPARLVGGFNGGQISAAGDELLVSNSNAHTWVEVWLGEARGWVTYDPTPVAGVPELGRLSGVNRLRWFWDQLQLFWDRYVLTFGTQEQVQMVVDAWQAGIDLMRRLGIRGLAAAPIAVALAWLTVLGVRFRRRRRGERRAPAAAAMARVAGRLAGAGEPIEPGTTLRRIANLASARWPRATAALEALVALAERELYAPARARSIDAREVRRLWAEVRRADRR